MQKTMQKSGAKRAPTNAVLQKPFGPHVTIDANDCDFQKMTDYKLIYDVLNELPEFVGMHKMTLPLVVPWMDNGATVEGISGFVMIAESHISIHTFPEKNYIFIDIFSCKPFDIEKGIDFFKERLGIKNMTVNVVQRGLDFPRGEDGLY
jgi:S-adenosylmethionine decarboxylase